MIISILLGSILIATGIFLMISQYRLRLICTVQTQGVVSGVEAFRSEEPKMFLKDSITHTHVTYAPVFTYFANGREVVKRSPIKSAIRFQIGSTVTLFYRPDNVEEYYVVEDKIAKYAGVFFAFIGSIFLTAGIISMR